jgi:hypothetical protein
MRVSSTSADSSILSELLALTILRGASDSLTFTLEEQHQLRRLFPDGFALLAYGDESGTMGMRLVGGESKGLVEQIHDEIGQGQLDTLHRLFGRQDHEQDR